MKPIRRPIPVAAVTLILAGSLAFAGVNRFASSGPDGFAPASLDGEFDRQVFSGPLDLSVGTDNQLRVLFAGFDNRAAVTSIHGTGDFTCGQPLGPYNGWIAEALADGVDGLTRILWNHVDGSAALWFLGPAGNLASYRFGPEADEKAVDVSVGFDDTTHLLRTSTDGRAELLSVSYSGSVIRNVTLGPYSGWVARSIADGTDGLTRLLWSHADGRIGLSLVAAGRLYTTYRFTPPAGWTAQDITVARDNRARILLVQADGRAAIWSLDNSGVVSNTERVYAPDVAGETPAGIVAGIDGVTRLLWTKPDGTGTVWLLDLDNNPLDALGLDNSCLGGAASVTLTATRTSTPTRTPTDTATPTSTSTATATPTPTFTPTPTQPYMSPTPWRPTTPLPPPPPTACPCNSCWDYC